MVKIPKALVKLGFENTQIDDTIASMEIVIDPQTLLRVWVEDQSPSRRQRAFDTNIGQDFPVERFSIVLVQGEEERVLITCERESEMVLWVTRELEKFGMR